MSCAEDIALLVDRLYLANIPIANLCYQVDEKAWPGFVEEIKALGGATRPDTVVLTYMGLTVRKR
jgi:hypothetical protein